MVFDLTANQEEMFNQAKAWGTEAELTKNWEDAAVRWQLLCRAFQDNPIPYCRLIKSLLELDNPRDAEQVYLDAKERFPNALGVQLAGFDIRIARDRRDDAREILCSMEKKHPDSTQVWIKWGEWWASGAQFERAAEAYRKACDLMPDLPMPYVAFANYAMKTKQWELALQRWEKVRELFPKVPAGYLRAAEAARLLGDSVLARQLEKEQFSQDQSSTEFLHPVAPPDHVGNTSTGHRFVDLVWIKSWFNLRSELQDNYLSYLWWFIEPFLHLAVYFSVFGFLLNRGEENYAVFLMTGLVPWMWFLKAVSRSSSSILNNRNILSNISVPPIVFPLISNTEVLVKQLLVFVILFCFLMLAGLAPEAIWLWVLPIMFVQLMVTVTLSCLLAAVIPFVRDLNYVVPTGLTFLMFVSGVFFDYRYISPEWRDVFLLNPIAFLLKSYREVLLESSAPDFAHLAWIAITAFIVACATAYVYLKLRFLYPRIVME